MPLYVCSKCEAVDNTGLTNYWVAEMDAHEAGTKFEPLCSECETGEWHGRFTKQHVGDTDYVQDGKFLKHKSEML